MTIKMDFKKPYGTVYGHAEAAYQQDGKLYDGAGVCLEPPPAAPAPVPKAKLTLPIKPEVMDPLEGPKTFLKTILAGGPLTKSVVYKETESNNQSWPTIRDAADALGIKKFTQNKLEMWQLPETVA